MGVLTVEKSKAAWSVRGGSGSVEILLSQAEIAAIGPAERGLAGFDVRLSIIDPFRTLEMELPRNTQVIIIELHPEAEGSLRSLALLRANYPQSKIVAAIRDPALPVVRSLLRAGVHDVVQLPLDRAEVATILIQMREDAAKAGSSIAPRGRVVSVVKSVGGVGATSLLTQMAALYASKEAATHRETCLFDLDIQFGNAATYLGLSPALTVRDLLDAGARVDAALLRSTCSRHSSGLDVFAAPMDMMPLEAIGGDEICDLIDLAAQEYDTIFVDLPGSWTNWSLSIVARSDLVLLVTELSIASLRQARRVLDLLQQEDLSDVKVQIVMNRVEKKLFGSIGLRDAEAALRRPVGMSVANDFRLMSSALDQGVLLSEIKSKNRLNADLTKMIEGVDMLLAERS